MELRPVQCGKKNLSDSDCREPHTWFSIKSRLNCLRHSVWKVLANPSREQASNSPRFLSSPAPKLHRDIVQEKKKKMVRQSPSISPNVKVKSNRKQLTDVCPAESVGVPGRNECRHILAYHRVAPFTPHYPAKNNLSAFSAFCRYQHQSHRVSSFPLKASLNKWQERKVNSDFAQVQISPGRFQPLPGIGGTGELPPNIPRHLLQTPPAPILEGGTQPNCPLGDEILCGFIARSYL